MAVYLRVASVHDLDAPVGNRADVGGRPADIDGDEVAAAAQHAFGAAADDAAGWAGHQDADGLLRAGLDGGDAAVRLNDAQVGLETVRGELVLQIVEIEGGLGADKSVHRRGREALVFADDVGDFRRGADIGVRHFGANDFGGAPLVGVVEKRKQKADDDRFDTAALEQRDSLGDLLLVERDFDSAVGRQDALGHGDAVAALDQGPLLPRDFEMQGKIVGPLVPADMENVAEVARREHSDFGAVMLNGDIGGNRGPVDDQRYILGLDAGDVAEFAQALEHAFRLVVRRACDFMDEDAMIGLEHEVGIGPADVDAYARHGSPDLPRAVPDPDAQRLVRPIAEETLSVLSSARNPRRKSCRHRRCTLVMPSRPARSRGCDLCHEELSRTNER